MARIFYLMGKSSSGKDTIYANLFEDKSLNLQNVVGYTTRPIRDGEKPGKQYIFVDAAQMQKLAENDKIIEQRSYNTVYGVWNYFTADDGQIDISSSNDYLLIGTLDAYIKVKEYFKTVEVIPLYIEVEDSVRLTRAIKREKAQKIPKYVEMCRRFITDTSDFSDEKLKKAQINKRYDNYNLTNCLDEIKQVIIDK